MQQAIMGAAAGAPANEVVLPSSQMSGEERLAIYQRAYLARLIECLRAEYPQTCRALGESLFDSFAAGYLAKHPSTSYTLEDLGRNFPAYLADSAAHESSAAEWRHLLVDLATLEWTTADVFNGPGVEHQPPLDPAQLAPEAWDTLHISLAPCVRLLDLQYPVHKYYRRLRDQAESPPPAAARTRLIVSRLDYTVRHHAVSEPQSDILRGIERGDALSTALAAAANCFSGDLDQFAAELHGWFVWFAAERLLVVS